jgi:uncharacterized membrane protein
MWGFGGGLMLLGPLFMILVVIAIYFVITSSSRGSTHVHYRHHDVSQDYYPSQGRAIEVLNERFAKGEITHEQFLQMRQTMEAT